MTRRPKCGWIAAAILTLLAGAAQDGAQAAVLSGMEPLAPHSATVSAAFRLPSRTIGRLPGGRLPGVGKRPGPISKGLLNKTPKGVAGTNATGRTTAGRPPKPSSRSCTAASRPCGPRSQRQALESGCCPWSSRGRHGICDPGSGRRSPATDCPALHGRARTAARAGRRRASRWQAAPAAGTLGRGGRRHIRRGEGSPGARLQGGDSGTWHRGTRRRADMASDAWPRREPA